MKLLLLLCFPLFLNAQNALNPRVSSFIDSFDKSTNYFFVEETHPGLVLMVREVQYDCFHENYYVFTEFYWKDKSGNYFKKKFYPCSETDAKKIDSKAYELAIGNFELIKNEEVLPYQTKPDRIEDGKIIKYFSVKSHTAFRYYFFRKNDEIFSKKFDAYFITTEGDNINYEHNQNLKLIQLENLILGEED